ncbi:MAG: hypothetical protein VXW12_01290 [Pseudomonadota bacterium]|nr:hypothetical protein [Pseudomonadota bacterium]
MKFKYFFYLFFLFSCTSNYTKYDNRLPYNAKGFAYIYINKDYKQKSSEAENDNANLQVFHKGLKTNTLLKIINLKTQDYIILKNSTKISYPEIYKILISDTVAKKINLDKNLPYVEILELKKNKSFVAKKAKIYNEEKKISTNAPVTSVQISNISEKTASKVKKIRHEFFIKIASFYAEDSAKYLKGRIIKEIPNLDVKKLKIAKKNNKEINLILGPYDGINLMKNDYSQLLKFGIEELDIVIDKND